MPTVVVRRPDVTVEVTGADRLTYLDAVLSQQLRDRPARTVTSALELDARGNPLSVCDVVVLEDRVLLVAPTAAVAIDLVERLGSRTFLSDAAFSPSQLEVVVLRGPAGRAVAASAGLDVEPGRVEPRVGAVIVGHRDGVDVLVDGADADEVVQALLEAGATVGGDDDLDAWRVATGTPRWGHEVTPPHLPEEVGLLPTHVHLGKGCYPGQEAVARMWMLGRPRRRLARVSVHGDLEPGWSAGEGRRRAELTGVTTWEGSRVGLAFVPGDAAVGARFAGDGGELEVLELVGEGERVPGHDPDVLRRRDRRGA